MKSVFIIGPAKSGTTLLISLFDDHSELSVIPLEIKYYDIFNGLNSRKENYKSLYHYFLDKSKLKLIRENKSSTLDPMNTGYQDYSCVDFDQFEKQLGLCAEQYDSNKKPSEKAQLKKFIIDLHDVFSQEKDRLKKKGFAIKEGNHGLPYIQNIKTDFPDAKIIVMNRDPRDMYASLKSIASLKRKGGMFPSFNASVSVMEFLFSNPGKSCLAYMKCMDTMSNDRQILFVRYEDLVSNTKNVMQKVARFLKIRFEDSLLEPTSVGISWTGNASDAKEIKGVTSRRRNKWKQELNKTEIIILEHFLREYLDKNGYKCKYDIKTTFKLLSSINILQLMGTPPSNWKDFIRPFYKMGRYVINTIYYSFCFVRAIIKS